MSAKAVPLVQPRKAAATMSFAWKEPCGLRNVHQRTLLDQPRQANAQSVPLDNAARMEMQLIVMSAPTVSTIKSHTALQESTVH
jgi:hypothetical protein